MKNMDPKTPRSEFIQLLKERQTPNTKVAEALSTSETNIRFWTSGVTQRGKLRFHAPNADQRIKIAAWGLSGIPDSHPWTEPLPSPESPCELFRQVVSDRKISQSAAGTALGVTQACIHGWLTAKYIPGPSNRKRITMWSEGRVPQDGDWGVPEASVAPEPSEVPSVADQRGIDLTRRHTEIRKLLLYFHSATIARNGWETDEVLQRVYLKIMVSNRGTKPYDPAKGSFSHWVRMVCDSVVQNYHRSQSRFPMLMTEDQESYHSETSSDLSSPDPERMALAHQVWERPRSEQDQQILEDWLTEVPSRQSALRLGMKSQGVLNRRQRIVKQSASLL